MKDDVSLQNETGDSLITRRNKEIYGIAYLFVLVFLGMTVYLIWFIAFRGDEIQNNKYNARVSEMASSTVRGTIYSEDGSVLAYTDVDSEGNETRVYPYANAFSHVVGYIINGGLGVESNYSYYLLSAHLGVASKLNADFSGVKEQGDNLYLTLDSNLQQVAYNALGDYNGAVVAIEPSTGKILCMVSKPDFDPNTLAENWAEITDEESGNSSLYNRATLGLYPPGSTFKVLTTLEYYRENPDFNDDIMYECDGTYETEFGEIHCSELEAHGSMRLSNGLAMSCNGIFAMIGRGLDTSSFVETCNSFLFNTAITDRLDVNISSFSLTADSSEWDKMQTAIGQGETLVTPLHEALIAATIANDGVMMEPYVVDRVENANGVLVEQFEPEELATPLTEQESAWLTAMMENVVNNGTAYKAGSDSYAVAGKTGSAQYENSANTHAVFMGFAPADDPKIAICVYVEQGGSGGNVAAPIAKQVFDAYMGEGTSE